MIGLIHHGPSDTDGVAPSVSPALYSVGGTPAVTRAMNELTSVVDEMLLLTDDADVRSAAARADDSVAVVPDLDAVRDRFADAHDRLIVASASTHVGRSDLRSLTACTDAVLRSAAIPNGHPPHEMYSIDFPLGDAQPIDGDIDSIRDLVDALSARTHESELTADRLYDVARPWDLLAATEHVLDGIDRSIEGTVHPTADCSGSVVVEPGARIGAGVVIEGPAFVARNASIGPNAYVRGASYLGENCHVGHGVEVKNSVLFSDARVPHLSYVGDSVVGPSANLGAGTVVANLRHDGEPVALTHAGKRASTGRRKFGAVVGENARLGIGTRVNAGVSLSPGSTTAPGETVLRDVSRDGEERDDPERPVEGGEHAATDTTN